MTEIKPKFVPGIIKDDSKLAAEGGWVDSDKMRFVDDKPQVIGGWQELSVTNNPSVPFDSNVFDSGVFDSVFTQTSVIYPGKVRGAHAWADNDGNSYLAWGTGSGLFLLHGGIVYDITPADFTPESSTGSLPYGKGAYGAGIYGRGSRVMWSLDNWGQNLLANPRGGSLYEWAPTYSKALVVANAPTEINSFFVSPERIVVLLGTTGFGSSFSPLLVRWSDQGDNTAWTPSPSNLAGEFPLASGSKIVGGLAARGLDMVWTDAAAYMMGFNGSVFSVFTIRPAGYGCGLVGPHAMTASDSAVYWASHDNFYGFNGQTVSILPCTVRQDVFDNLYPGSEEKMHFGWNTGYGEVWAFYPDTRDGTGECSRYTTVNAQGQWAVGTFDRTAWVKADVFPYPIAFSANKLYYQEVPGAPGPSDAFIESGFIDVGDGDTLYLIKRIVPDFNNQGPDINISLKTKFWPNENEVVKGPYLATPTKNKLDMRVKARQMAVKLASAGAATNSFWELGAIGFDSQPSGEKR